MSRFKKAVRQQAKLRLGLDGPSGSGKSLSALRFAFAFPNARVACIEAGENGGLSLYQGMAPDGVPFEFDLLEIKSNFSPGEYTAAIEEAGREKYDVLVIDSLSHAWAGAGGALEQVGSAGFTDRDGWRKVTPQHNRMIDAILQSPCHVIATIRSKTEYVIEEVTNDRGKKVQVPKKIGMAPIQRAGMEYEFTVFGSIDQNHTLTVHKSRCPAVQDAIVHKPGANFMHPVMAWLETGEAVAMPEVKKRVGEEQRGRIEKLLTQTGRAKEFATRGLAKYNVESIRELTEDDANTFEATISAWLDKKRQQEEGATPAPGTAEAATAAGNGTA